MSKVSLKSSDQKTFQVDEAVAKKSQMLKNLIDGNPPFIQIPVLRRRYFCQTLREAYWIR